MSRFSELQKRFKSNKYTGFGSGTNNQGDRLLNRDGTFNVIRNGQGFFQSLNPFHQLITMPWGYFNTMIILVFILLNLTFTMGYFIIGLEELSGVFHTSMMSQFIEVFSFSAQTLTTVGYGRVSPIGDMANLLASFEALLGLMSFALVTGLLYGRFSRPYAKLLYSEKALISPYQDKTAFMFRIANARKNQLIECEATLLFNYQDKEAGTRRFINLDLEFAKVNALSLSWTIVHPIDEKSPMYGLNQKELIEMNPEIILMFKAFDDTYSQIIHTRHSYAINEIVYGAKFLPMFKRSENGYSTLLELNKIGQYQQVELPNS
jgi:inward rectifier potassium channel